MQSVVSNVQLVARIIGGLDDLPTIACSSCVSRSFREAGREAKCTRLVIVACDDVFDARRPRPPSLVDIVEWMRRNNKLLAELTSVDIRTHGAETPFLQPEFLVNLGIIFQLLYDARPIHVKITSDLLYSKCNTMPDSVKDLTVVARDDTEEQVNLSTFSDLFPQLERLVMSHTTFFIDDKNASLKHLRYLQIDSLANDEGEVDCQFPALEELTYIIHTHLDDATITCINELLQHSTLRKAHFIVHSSVTRLIIFEMSPDPRLELTVDRHVGASRVGFRSPTKWH